MTNFARTALLIALLTALFLVVGQLIGGPRGAMMAFIIACALNFIAYWNADKIVLSMYDAQQITPTSNPQYYQLVNQLAHNAGLVMPKVYIINSAQPNAFATGRNPENAAVAATTGLLNLLSPRELAGVIAHELAHIKNRDTLTMTITATLAGAIGYLAQLPFLFAHRSENGEKSIGAIGHLIMMILAPLIALLVQMAISRTREYEADALGAAICRDPMALASALSKIEAAARSVINPQAENNPATAHLFIINPLSGQSMDNLFSTHPNTKNRILKLQDLAKNYPSFSDFQPSPPSPRGPWSQN